MTPQPSPGSTPPVFPAAPRSFGALLGAGVFCWVGIAVGFLGLHMLMQERPEFVGQPMRSSKTELIQDSPRVVLRKLSDDVAVIQSAQPSSSEITFDMRGRRDYRGLRTVMDMSGEFHARHVLTNAFDEPIFVLFKCPHPRSKDDGLLAGGLKLNASAPGIQENAKDAWFWSGTIEARGTVSISTSYQAASLKSVTYRMDGPHDEPVKHLRVAFNRQDLASVHFESGDGAIPDSGESVVWERKDFLAPDSFSASIAESRNLYGSLLQVLEIGPIICLLFLLAVTAIILARQPFTALQLITISAGYALYFPLMLYLSSRFSFPVALTIAVIVPGALLVNYSRLLLGTKIGIIGGTVFLLLYQVFPTLAAFAGWNRGMVLLCLGVVTFAVLINLQNQALKRKAAATAAALLFMMWPTLAADVQVIVPGQLVTKLSDAEKIPTPPVLSFEPAEYQIVQEPAFFRVEVKVAFQVIREGDALVPLFAQALHLQAQKIESAAPDLARFGTVKNRPALLALRPGAGSLHFIYRVAVENHEGRQRAQFPLLIGPSGNVKIESLRADLEITSGSLWSRTAREKQTVYDIGVAGEELLTVEWREQGGAPAPETGKEFYGIGITRAQHLTVINSDSSCTHFAEFEVPAFQSEELRLRLPPKARLISVSVDGVEAAAPALEDQVCRIRLPAREAGQAAHHVSFRLAYPPVPLGFIGSVELPLPEVFQTVGTLEWIIALPGGFETQVLSSGLTVQKTPPDLTRFGDYGRILKSHPQSALVKDLAPPGPVSLNLRYRQQVPAMEQ